MYNAPCSPCCGLHLTPTSAPKCKLHLHKSAQWPLLFTTCSKTPQRRLDTLTNPARLSMFQWLLLMCSGIYTRLWLEGLCDTSCSFAADHGNSGDANSESWHFRLTVRSMLGISLHRPCWLRWGGFVRRPFLGPLVGGVSSHYRSAVS